MFAIDIAKQSFQPVALDEFAVLVDEHCMLRASSDETHIEITPLTKCRIFTHDAYRFVTPGSKLVNHIVTQVGRRYKHHFVVVVRGFVE